MSRGWETYSVVFLSAFLSLGIPAGLALISRLTSARRTRVQVQEDRARAVTASDFRLLGQRVNVRFFLAMNSALILVTVVLFMLPLVVYVSKEKSIRSLGGVALMTLLLALGLFYSSKKGDLGWSESLRKKSAGSE